MANPAEAVSDRYELRKKIAAGPISTVYEGWDCAIRRRVAVKEVPLTENGWEHLTRFRREAQAAGRLQHPQIVGIFDYYETSNCAYIVMEFVEGATLKALLDREKRMPLSAVVRLMEDVLAGLQYSHDQGVVHRDLKPSNIMITREGRAKIADFGIARLEDSSITQIGAVMGTPAYMSPEQFCGKAIEASTDIYSAGVILYELLTGTRPFDGGIATIMHKALNTAPQRPSEISDAVPRLVDSVVLRAIAKRPQQRFGSASEFAQALRKASTARKDEAVVQPKAAGGSRLQFLREMPSRVLYAAAGLLALVAALGAGAVYWRSATHRGPAATHFAQPDAPPAPSAVGTASLPADAPGGRNDGAATTAAAPAEQRHGPDPTDTPAPGVSTASEQPAAILPAPLPASVPQAPPPMPADADPGVGPPVPAPPAGSFAPAPPTGSVATLDTGPKEWENALRPVPPRRIEPVAPPAPRVPVRRSPPPAPGPRAPAEGAAPPSPAPARPADRDTETGESARQGTKGAPAPKEQESAPPPPRSFGRYEVQNGRRIFVPAPSSDPTPPADAGPPNSPPVTPGRPERQGEDRHPNGESAQAGPVPATPPDVKGRTPPNADQDGSAAPPKSFGRYETQNGRRVYIPAE